MIQEGKENEAIEIDVMVDLEADFKPVEHPPEPLDEDRPVVCPMSDSSLFSDKGIWKELESLEKRAESSIENEARAVGHSQQEFVQGVCKRHHTLAEDHPILPSLGSLQNNIFPSVSAMLEFES